MNPPPTASATGNRRTAGAAGARTAAASAAKALLDLRHQPGVRVEELLLHLRPAAEVVDGELLRPHGEAVALRRDLEHGPVAARCEELLRRGRVEVLRERLRLGLLRAARRHRERVVDADCRLRDVEVDRLAASLRE